MAIRQLSKSETDTLFIQLTLAGLIPGRDFKFDETGQIRVRPAVVPIVRRIPPIPDENACFYNARQPESQQSATPTPPAVAEKN